MHLIYKNLPSDVTAVEYLECSEAIKISLGKVNSSFIYPDSDVTIYNRWGNKVFESKSDDFVFKGLNKNGNELVEGTYFYVVRLKNERDPIKGTISLFR